MNKARVITTALSVLIVYLSHAFVLVEWNPFMWSETARLSLCWLGVAAPVVVATCPFWALSDD